VNDELLGKIITSLIQFKLTKESKYYLDTIDLLDELVLETTGPQHDIGRQSGQNARGNHGVTDSLGPAI
jgi:hypothetical protein